MALDIRYLLQNRSHDTMPGKYYATRPKSPADIGVPFPYEMVDPKESAYRRIFANVLGNDIASTTIKTVLDLGFAIKAYVILKDGGMYQIISTGEDEQAVKSKQAFRHMRNAAGTEYYLRLIQVSNPWEVT